LIFGCCCFFGAQLAELQSTPLLGNHLGPPGRLEALRAGAYLPAEGTHCPTPLYRALPHMTAPKGRQQRHSRAKSNLLPPWPMAFASTIAPSKGPAFPSPIHPPVVLPIYMDWEIFQEATDAGDRKGRASFTHKTLHPPHPLTLLLRHHATHLLHNCSQRCSNSLFIGGSQQLTAPACLPAPSS
jgi:hypothetical protein